MLFPKKETHVICMSSDQLFVTAAVPDQIFTLPIILRYHSSISIYLAPPPNPKHPLKHENFQIQTCEVRFW